MGVTMIVLIYHCLVTYYNGGQTEAAEAAAGQMHIRAEDAVVANGQNMPPRPTQGKIKISKLQKEYCSANFKYQLCK